MSYQLYKTQILVGFSWGLWSSRIVWEWSGVQGLIALLQPITVTVHLQDMNMMCQPI